MRARSARPYEDMNKNEILRKIPQVDEILKDEKLASVVESTPHDFLVSCIREVLVDLRANILNGVEDKIDKDSLAEKIKDKVSKKSKRSLRRVINATGTVLHTNLGRAVISKDAVNAMMDVACNYSNLEYDIKAGKRGNRQSHIEKIITAITGAESAMVVNNNAAATILVLAALAEDKEVIISRGELIEIGDSFRLPDVMGESNAILREIGSTNKTKLNDYIDAIDENKTAAILKAHTSNYKIVGFTEQVELKELIPLGDKYNLPIIYDMGNGLIVDLNEYGIDEPTVRSLVNIGADIVLFSGDKLLGGPQAGIIVGKAKYITKMKKHPLARAFRVDKFTLAALNSTLFEYYDEKRAKKNIPILNMITMSEDELKKKAEMLMELLKKSGVVNDKTKIEIEKVKDQVGGGTAPTVYLPGYAVTFYIEGKPAEKIERDLRELEVPIIARVAHDKIYLDVRTILDDDINVVVDELKCKILL